MHVGADYHYIAGGPGAEITGKANLAFNTRLGVRHLTAQVRETGVDGSWDLDELKRMRDNCDTAGVVLEAIRMDSQYIMLTPGRRVTGGSMRSWATSRRPRRWASR
jgi:hypothetical protein